MDHIEQAQILIEAANFLCESMGTTKRVMNDAVKKHLSDSEGSPLGKLDPDYIQARIVNGHLGRYDRNTKTVEELLHTYKKSKNPITKELALRDIRYLINDNRICKRIYGEKDSPNLSRSQTKKAINEEIE